MHCGRKNRDYRTRDAFFDTTIAEKISEKKCSKQMLSKKHSFIFDDSKKLYHMICDESEKE